MAALAESLDEFAVRSPSDGSTLAIVPIHDRAAVGDAVARARVAQGPWGALSVRERARHMIAFGRLIEERAEDIAHRLVSETGKPHTEALAEIVISMDLIRFYSRVAPRHMRRRRVSPAWLIWKSAFVEREPYGVIGAITPWNYPLLLVLDAVTAALFAGNAVVTKPSEFTPLTTLMLAGLSVEAGLPPGLFGVVTGFGATGEALVRSGVDRMMFTGSAATGRRVMAVAAESLTPVSLELGGKDPAIVLADADLVRAANGIAFGAFFNAGQTCISIERVYVERQVFEQFSRQIVQVAAQLRVGSSGDVDLGPMITEAQFAVVTEQVRDALARGARALIGGAPLPGDRRLYPPTILVDVDDSMSVMRDETFGPILTLIPVEGEEEAIARANQGGFGLFASVWTGDRRRGLRVARRLRAGGVSVNDSLAHFAVPGLPMGGVGESGFGSRRGLEGLDEVTRPRAMFVDRLGLRREPWWFPYTAGSSRLNRTVLAWRAHPGLGGVARALRRMVSGG